MSPTDRRLDEAAYMAWAQLQAIAFTAPHVAPVAQERADSLRAALDAWRAEKAVTVPAERPTWEVVNG